nr:MAG TPA: hypothetical protein [Caudoviricetes sp.]
MLSVLTGLNHWLRETLVLPFKLSRCFIGYTPVNNGTLP